MNMGVADGVDLGWKIAATIEGWGGAGLLDSYETERRFAHEYVLDEAESNQSLNQNGLCKPQIEEMSEAGENARAEGDKLVRSGEGRVGKGWGRRGRDGW